MIGKTNVGGGGGNRVTVVINAPKNSWVVYSGAENGTLQLGNLTQASAVLKKGTYIFVSHINLPNSTSTVADTVIYTATIAINADKTINLYPAKTLYWYGITAAEVGGWHSSVGASYNFSNNNDNNLALIWSGNPNQGTRGAFRTTNSINFDGYTKIKFRSAYGEPVYSSPQYPQGGYTISAWSTLPSSGSISFAVSDTITNSQFGQEEKGVSIENTNGYISVYVHVSTAIIYAIWLE